MCRSPDRVKIDRALILRDTTIAHMVTLYGFSYRTYERHRAHILPAFIAEVEAEAARVKGAQSAEVIAPDDAVAQLTSVIQRTDRLLRAAEARTADGKGSVAALRLPAVYLRELRETYRLDRKSVV